MPRSLRIHALIAAATLVGLLAARELAPLLPDHGISRFLSHAVAESAGRDVRRHQTGGYYEWLLQGRSHRPGLILMSLLRRQRANQTDTFDAYERGGFLRYKLKPNVSSVDSEEGAIITNRYGLLDGDYSLEKPANTRRVVWLGSSMDAGWNTPLQQRFESRFEDAMNRTTRAELGENFEVLNFSESGYRLTQRYYVALEETPAFHPDAYVISLSELDLLQTWSDHLAQLISKGEDLKYDLFRRTVAASGAVKSDPWDVVTAKLQPYRLPLLRSMLASLKQHADQQSASLIVVIVPAAEDTELVQVHFAEIREIVEKLGIPVVDLTDTFQGIRDVETMRFAWYDAHPNAAAHAMLAENLYRKLRQTPAAWQALVGPTAAPADDKSALRAFQRPTFPAGDWN